LSASAALAGNRAAISRNPRMETIFRQPPV